MESNFYYGDQRTYEWFQLRLGKMTGSQLKNIIDRRTYGLKSNILPAIAKIIAERETGLPCDAVNQSASMKWGCEVEPEAIKILSEKYPGYKPVSFVIKSEYFGMSPDMIFFKDEIPVAGCEIKCPDSKTHVFYCLEDEIPGDYELQVLSYFLAIETLEKMKFASYDPRNLRRPLFEKNISRSEVNEKLEKISESLAEFERILAIEIK